MCVCTQEVANLPEGKKKGIGICTGPVISDVPTASDWIEYYTGESYALPNDSSIYHKVILSHVCHQPSHCIGTYRGTI